MAAAAAGSSWRSAVWEQLGTIKESIEQVPLPREIMVCSKRLGYLYRTLQLGALVVAIANVVIYKIWQQDFHPRSKGVSVWREDASADELDEDPLHCTKVADYAYNWSSTEQYNPVACKRLPSVETSVDSGDILYVPTYARDAHVWEASRAADCGAEARQRCEASARGAQFVDGPGDGAACRCRSEEEFLFAQAEKAYIVLNHGYEVAMDIQGVSGRRQVGLSAWGGAYVEGPSEGETMLEGQEGEILTILLDKHGQPCELGGRSRWSAQEARGGVRATMQEWLRCGGLVAGLDEKSANGRSGSSSASSSDPTARITGVHLDLSLYYVNYGHGEDFAGIVCYVRVHALPMWNFRTVSTILQLPGIFQNPSVYRYRRSQGVSVKVHTSGKLAFWDAERFLNGLLNSIVILSIPSSVMRLFVFYCLGLLSIIYYHAVRTPFSIYKEFHGVSARMMAAAACFRDLRRDWTSKGDAIQGLNVEELKEHLTEVFHADILGGSLASDEISIMANVIFDQIDDDGDRRVDMDEFIIAVTSNDSIHIRHFAQYFSRTRTRSLLEWLMDDSAKKVKRVEQQLQRQKTRGLQGVLKLALSDADGFEGESSDGAQPIGNPSRAGRAEAIADGSAKSLELPAREPEPAVRQPERVELLVLPDALEEARLDAIAEMWPNASGMKALAKFRGVAETLKLGVSSAEEACPEGLARMMGPKAVELRGGGEDDQRPRRTKNKAKGKAGGKKSHKAQAEGRADAAANEKEAAPPAGRAARPT